VQRYTLRLSRRAFGLAIRRLFESAKGCAPGALKADELIAFVEK